MQDDADARGRRRALAVLLAGLAISVGFALLFAWLSDEVLEGSADKLDLAVIHWFAAHRTENWTDFFLAVTALGSRPVLILFTAGGVILFLLAKRRGMAFTLATSMIGALLLSAFLKLAFHRSRPPLELHVTNPSGYSFPSGHAIASFTFFVTLALLAATHVRGRPLRICLLVYAVVVAALVAVSRMYLGVHYLTDVIGGALVGSAWSIAVVLAEHVWRHRAHLARRAPPVENPA